VLVIVVYIWWLTTILKQIEPLIDLSFKELSEVPNLYHSSCESKEVSYEDICPALSPQFAIFKLLVYLIRF
jgi:hypothetical protein